MATCDNCVDVQNPAKQRLDEHRRRELGGGGMDNRRNYHKNAEKQR